VLATSSPAYPSFLDTSRVLGNQTTAAAVPAFEERVSKFDGCFVSSSRCQGNYFLRVSAIGAHPALLDKFSVKVAEETSRS
jgi:hypothetical protein